MANYINQILVYDAGKNRKIGAADNLEIGGGFTAANVNGDGAGLTNLQSSALTGALPALDGSALTNLSAAEVTGAGLLSDSVLSSNVPLLNAGALNFAGSIEATAFIGNGADLTSLAAGNITTGTLADGILSSNVAKYNDPTPSFDYTLSALGFSGGGALLTGLNATELTSGEVPDGVIPSNILRKNADNNTLTGNLSIGGNLSVTGDIISGGSVNVVLQDQFLDLNGNNLLGTATSGGIAVNVLSTGSTFDVESFTAGGTGTDPAVVVSGDASALAAGALIQISQSASSNDGQYIVYSASYNAGTGKTTVTVRGNAASAHPTSTYSQLPFVHNQFSTATETAKLVAITVGVMAVSNGGLYAAGHVAVPEGDWCFAYGNDVAEFEDNWISVRPSSTPSLQTVYNSSSPATITLDSSKPFQIVKPSSGTTFLYLNANADSEIEITNAKFRIAATQIQLNGGDVAFEKAGSIGGVTTGVVAEGTICYINSSGAAVASDQASGTDAALEVDGVVQADTDYLATVSGTKVRAAYVGSAPGVGEVVYLAGGADAGKCSTTLPSSGRVTKLGKCVVAGSAGLCTIVWKPEYIADL